MEVHTEIISMPSVSELARQDQENGATNEASLQERFTAAMNTVTATLLRIAHLDALKAAEVAQLKKEQAASVALLQELSGGGPRPQSRSALVKFDPKPFLPPGINFDGTSRAGG
jgi:hypothetical protein